MYVEMGNFDCTEIQLKSKNSQIFSVVISIPRVGTTGFTSSAADHEVIVYKVWVLYEQYKVFYQG